MSASDVTTICLMQCDTFLSHRVDCGFWNVNRLLFNGCAKLLDIGSNWNMLSHTPIQIIALTRVKTLTMPIAHSLKTYVALCCVIKLHILHKAHL